MAKMVSKMRLFAGALVALSAWLAPAAGTRASEVPVIAAASDLQYALAEIAEAFAKETKLSVKLSLGSSGNLARQIIQGAPYEVFFSADENYVHALAERSLTEDGGALYAMGRLALFVPARSPIQADGELNDLAAALADGRLRKLAIANPEHAPYGRAAQAALARKGIWEPIRTRLVLGENVSQTAQFAVSGSVQAALIAYSLVISERMMREGTAALVPQDWHAALRQRMVLVRGAGETAHRFFRFVQAPQARATLARFGFTVPTAGH